MENGFHVGDRITISGIVTSVDMYGQPIQVLIDGSVKETPLDPNINIHRAFKLVSRPASLRPPLKAGQVWMDMSGAQVTLSARDSHRSDYDKYPFYGQALHETAHFRTYTRDGCRYNDDVYGPYYLKLLLQDAPEDIKQPERELIVSDEPTHSVDYSKPVRYKFDNTSCSDTYMVVGKTLRGNGLVIQYTDGESMFIVTPDQIENVTNIKWVNIYSDMGYYTRAEADNHSTSERIACVRLEITHGDGI